MKPAKNILLAGLSAVAVLTLMILLGLAELRREIAEDRRRAERAVTATVERIGRLEPQALTTEAILNAAVAPAAVQVLGTNPVRVKVHAMTSWPDVMIYEYDSRVPERGVQHYLF